MDELVKVRQLVEAGWCKRASAINASGNYVADIHDPSVTALCLTGAIRKVGGNSYRLYEMIKEKLGLTYSGIAVPIMRWNDADERTKEDVLKLLDELIDDEQKRQQVKEQGQ